MSDLLFLFLGRYPHARRTNGYVRTTNKILTSAERRPLEDVIRVADFRAALRAFVHRHDQISRRAGLTPQRYLLLLMVKGAPDGSEQARFTDIAARLRLDRTTVTELVARAEAEGLLRREPSPDDRRAVFLRLTAEGERRLDAALQATEAERRALAAAFARLAETFDADPA